MGLYLIKYDGRNGIVKCSHLEKENTILLLQSLTQINSRNIHVIPIGSSGTIHSLTKKYELSFDIDKKKTEKNI